VIGALASAEERQLGTLDGQLLQPAPGWQQWMVKVGVTLGLALLLGVGLPVVLSVAARQEEFHPSVAGDLAVLVVLLTAGTLYISSLSASGVQAMAWSMPVGIGVILLIQAVTPVILKAATVSTDPVAVVAFTARAVSLVLTPLLLWFGFVNHTSHERTARRILRQTASIALLTVTAALLVALGARAWR
jgi:hypothetical protein